MKVADEEWTRFLRTLFALCADRFSPGDELVGFALTVASHQELITLVALIERSRENLKVDPDALSDLRESIDYARSD
ncbi:MAG: hypothetical protein EA427_04210, partial [Spirochaetaceae bacterium]